MIFSVPSAEKPVNFWSLRQTRNQPVRNAAAGGSRRCLQPTPQCLVPARRRCPVPATRPAVVRRPAAMPVVPVQEVAAVNYHIRSTLKKVFLSGVARRAKTDWPNLGVGRLVQVLKIQQYLPRKVLATLAPPGLIFAAALPVGRSSQSEDWTLNQNPLLRARLSALSKKSVDFHRPV